MFIGGPRQVGKTTLGLSFLNRNAKGDDAGYLNGYYPHTANRIRYLELPAEESILLFEEIHKYARWRNQSKGIYDTERHRRKILVTGSAQLDFYRKGGDLLVGRYRYFRLHPFSLRELSPKPTRRDVDALPPFGGFRETLFSQDENLNRIWQRDRISRVGREDLRDLETVREVSLIESLVDALPERGGSPLSVNSLREDLVVDHKTVECKLGENNISPALHCFAQRTSITSLYQTQRGESHFESGRIAVTP